jgi:hypothetical protein
MIKERAIEIKITASEDWSSKLKSQEKEIKNFFAGQ